MKRFLRRDWSRYSRLGKNRKKLQKWRRAKGRHNKIRKRRAGYPGPPLIGYKKPKAESGKINGKVPILVENMNDLVSASKNNILIISRRIGARKRIEVIKKANEMKLEIQNVEAANATK